MSGGDVLAKYQAFLSSTYADLTEERRAVTWQLLKANLIPAGMEDFGAAPDRGWETITQAIDECDYYILLLAGRYGSVDDSTGLSWTEREYDYAVSKGIPVLAFVREDPAITKDKMDTEAQAAAKLLAFRAKVRGAHLTASWKDASDLTAAVTVALLKRIREDEKSGGKPRPGWYRGGRLPPLVEIESLKRAAQERDVFKEKFERVDPTGDLHVLQELRSDRGKPGALSRIEKLKELIQAEEDLLSSLKAELDAAAEDRAGEINGFPRGTPGFPTGPK